MSSFRFKRLQRHHLARSGSTIAVGIPLPKTENGKVDRDCPASGCETRRFQLGTVTGEPSTEASAARRMRRSPGNPGTTCPYCGHDDDDRAFTTKEDERAALEFMKWAAREDLEDAVVDMMESAFRGSKDLRFKRTQRSPRPQPRARREDILREVACTACARRYGVYGFALFCPNCGAANLTEHFLRERELADAQIATAESVAADREHSFRALNNALEDVATALETAVRGVYVHIVRTRFTGAELERRTSKQAIGNRFQNIARGREAFREFGLDPYGGLSSTQPHALELALAKRHVIAHNQGIVDAAFVRQTGTGIQGRPVSLSSSEVREALDFSAAVLAHLEATCPELLPAARIVPPSQP